MCFIPDISAGCVLMSDISTCACMNSMEKCIGACMGALVSNNVSQNMCLYRYKHMCLYAG